MAAGLGSDPPVLAASPGLPAGVTRSRLRDVRAWWRDVHPRAPLGQRLYVVYCFAIYGLLGYGTVSSTAKVVLTHAALAAWGPALALVALLLGARWGAVQGPVVFSVADVAQLLGAPLPRRGLSAGRLVRTLALGAAAGALIGACAIAGLAAQPHGIEVAGAAGLVAGLALGGVLAVLAGWAVQVSARRERLLRRATWPLLAGAAALAWAANASALGRDFALWSGPWGWAVAPGSGVADGRWIATLALLAAMTTAAAVVAVRRCGHCPTERHFDRAQARSGAIASLASFDARTARRSLVAVSAGSSAPARRGGPRWLRVALARPAGQLELAVVWRDAIVTLRARERLLQAVVLAGGGTALGLVDGRPLAVLAGALCSYVGAALLLEPLRAETDAPNRVHALLRARVGRVLLSHAIVPAVVVTAAGALAALAAAIAGELAGDHGAACALAAVAAGPAITLCAALSARRGGRLPISVLSFAVAGDPSGGMGVIVGWLLLWPTTAVILGAVPAIVAASAPSSALTVALICCVAAPAVLAGALLREP
jgi:hypothetical protein